jgi:hypothetical protein
MRIKRTDWFGIILFSIPLIPIIIYSIINNHSPYYYIFTKGLTLTGWQLTMCCIVVLYAIFVGLFLLVSIIYFLVTMYTKLEKLDEEDNKKLTDKQQ